MKHWIVINMILFGLNIWAGLYRSLGFGAVSIAIAAVLFCCIQIQIKELKL